MSKKNKNNLNKGVASILIVFVIGMVSLLIGVSLQQIGFLESLKGRSSAGSLRAYYAANSGIDEAVYRLKQIDGFGYPGDNDFSFVIEDATVDVHVSGVDENSRTIETIGSWNEYVRRIRASVYNTNFKPGFVDAVHAGLGGVEIRNNSFITGKDDTDGNVYSRTFIKGAKNDHDVATGECKNASSSVYGSAYAVEKITKLADNDSGICITKDANAEVLEHCYVSGKALSPSIPGLSCPFNGGWEATEPPPVRELPDMGVSVLKKYLDSKGEKFSGDCIADGSGDPSDCTKGTGELGTVKIDGNFIKPSNIDLVIDGPVWVTGDIIFDSNSTISLGDVTTSQIVVADGIIESNSNLTYQAKTITDPDTGDTGKAFLLFLSTYDPGIDPADELFCDTPAISLYSNSESVLFYSTNGCLLVNANSSFHGAVLGVGIRIDNNSSVEYDPDLQGAIFGLTKTSGWEILEYEEY